MPFTLAHFRAWAADLILDTGESWHPEPFQEAFVADLFSGCPECWLIVPEGNGKTTLVAGLALYHAEHRPFASVPIAASSREQAEIMYRQAEGFVLRSPRLHEAVHSDIQAAKGKRKTTVPRFVTLEGYRRINHHAGGRIQVFAADDRTGDGVIPTLGIVDEMHRHRDLSLYRTWTGKLTKRGGQIIGISTRGVPGSDFEETLTKIRRTAGASVTRKGSHTRVATQRLVLHEWAVPETADTNDLRAVKAANPLRSVTIPVLRDKLDSPTMTLEYWQRFVCNRPRRGSSSAVQDIEWAAARTDRRIPEGEPIWLGLDVAWKWDTTAAVPFWMPDPDFRLFGPAAILVPPRDGTTLHPDEIKAALRSIRAVNPIHTVVMDMSAAEDIAAWIEDELGATVIDRGQGNQWAAQDYERFMEGLRTGRLHHSGDAGLTEHVLNAIARTLPLGDLRFDRPTPSRRAIREQSIRVIDALTAAAMVHTMATNGLAEPEFVSAYETQGLTFVGGRP